MLIQIAKMVLAVLGGHVAFGFQIFGDRGIFFPHPLLRARQPDSILLQEMLIESDAKVVRHSR